MAGKYDAAFHVPYLFSFGCLLYLFVCKIGPSLTPMPSFLNTLLAAFNRIIDSGVAEGSSVHHRYRIRSINSFCFFCPIISFPYLPIFYSNKIYLAFWCFTIANLLFLAVI